jgi:hypothetical protein
MYTRGDHGVPTIILEAVALHDHWIWHTFFGVLGSNNDINGLTNHICLSSSWEEKPLRSSIILMEDNIIFIITLLIAFIQSGLFLWSL